MPRNKVFACNQCAKYSLTCEEYPTIDEIRKMVPSHTNFMMLSQKKCPRCAGDLIEQE